MMAWWGLDVEFVEPVEQGQPLLLVGCIFVLAVGLSDEVEVSFVSCGGMVLGYVFG
jgi:hypothetical protein